MSTGIVEEPGRAKSFDDGRVRFNALAVLEDVRLGDSNAVSGCCPTVVSSGDDWWQADVSAETVARKSFVPHAAGDPVTFERAVRMQDCVGGHLVQGHVDAVGAIVEPVPDLRVRVRAGLMPYLVEKGSLTVDGVSLTVVTPLFDGFTVAIIPHTSAVYTAGHEQLGDFVNIEVDLIAKHVERMLTPHLTNTASTVRVTGGHRFLSPREVDG